MDNREKRVLSWVKPRGSWRRAGRTSSFQFGPIYAIWTVYPPTNNLLQLSTDTHFYMSHIYILLYIIYIYILTHLYNYETSNIYYVYLHTYLHSHTHTYIYLCSINIFVLCLYGVCGYWGAGGGMRRQAPSNQVKNYKQT